MLHQIWSTLVQFSACPVARCQRMRSSAVRLDVFELCCRSRKYANTIGNKAWDNGNGLSCLLWQLGMDASCAYYCSIAGRPSQPHRQLLRSDANELNWTELNWVKRNYVDPHDLQEAWVHDLLASRSGEEYAALCGNSCWQTLSCRHLHASICTVQHMSPHRIAYGTPSASSGIS